MNENELVRYWTVILRRWPVLLATVIPLVTAAVLWSMRSPPVYRATVQLIIEKEKENSSNKQEGVDVDTADQDYYQTQYKLLKKRTLARQVYSSLGLSGVQEFKAPDENSGVNLLLQHIYVDPDRGSRLVNVSVESVTPALAAKIANALADAFVKQNLENRLHASREILNKLPANAQVTDMTDQQLVQALPAVVNNPLIQSLKNELVKYQTEYNELSQRYKGRHPALMAAGSRVEYLRQQIDKEMKNAVGSVRSELSGDFKANNVRVVDYAQVPKAPVKPDTKNNAAMAFALSLVLGFGIIYFIENLNLTIKEGADIEQYLEVPFLGLVPFTRKRKDEEMVVSDAHGEAAEAIKTIRTNITFTAPEEKLKTLLFTSCAPGAGKTFASLNISAAFAQGGKRVLLVDADLRRGTLSGYMNTEETKGLSDFLVNGEQLSGLVQGTDIPNLTFLSAGTRTPNPAEMLSSKEMKEFVEKARGMYDRVIFDSAPVLPVSDTLNIASLMDGVVYVVFCGKLSYKLVNLGKKKLLGVGARITGAILNYVNIKAHGYDYGYHRSYGKYY
ncbi:MAG: GumC family protein [Endomicrobiales bacterium]